VHSVTVFLGMINPVELRLGNYVLHKASVRILPTRLDFSHFELLAKGQVNAFFPVALKVDILQKCGFTENKKYYQAPEVLEFVLPLPVKGNNKNEILAYVGKETYARAVVNEIIITNHIYHLHQLQNLYYALTSAELDVMV
jgi:hypothetical protein